LSEQSLKAQTLLGIANEEWRGQRQAICRAGFNVESATLTIHTRGETVASAGLNVVVLKAGSKRTLTSGQKLTVSLDAAAPLGLEAEVPAQLQRQLRNALAQVAEVAAFLAAQDGPDDLQGKSIGVVVSFDVVEAVSGDLALSFGPVALSGGGSNSSTGLHSLEFKFARAEAPRDCE
jgi:hypothetical protein